MSAPRALVTQAQNSARVLSRSRIDPSINGAAAHSLQGSIWAAASAPPGGESRARQGYPRTEANRLLLVLLIPWKKGCADPE